MSDFQVILFMGNPASGDMTAFLEDFGQDGMLTLVHSARIEPDMEAVQTLLDQSWPDLICIFADDLEAQGEDVVGFVRQLREQLLKYRPVVVVHSGAPKS